MMEKPDSLFDAYYYQHNCGNPYQRNELWLNFFGAIAQRIKDEIQPGSMLDAGCAMGFLVESLRKIDVEAYGVDISEYAIQNAHESIRSYVSVGSVTEPFAQKYELIISIEVLEHLSKENAEIAIANLCKHTDDILFSSTPFDYKEVTHYNVQPPDYWMEQFARYGFIRDLDYDASYITPWAVRLRRRREPLQRIVREYDRKLWLLNKENQDLRALSQEKQNEIVAAELRIATLEARVVDLETRWGELEHSTAWRVVRSLQALRLKLIPLDSRRNRLLRKILR
jgi:hypothetical protein